MIPFLSTRRDRGSLAGHLLHDSFDPDGQVFVARDGSLGIVWRLGQKDTEIATPSELETLSSRFADLFRHLPEGSAAQFILESRREVGGELARFREGGGQAGQDLEGLFEDHAAMLAGLEILHGGAPYVARTLSALFTLRIFPGYGTGSERVAEDYRKGKSSLLEAALGIENFLTQIAIPFRRLDAGEMTGLLYRLLNPGREGAGASRTSASRASASRTSATRAFRPGLPLRDQVVRSQARFDYRSGIITLGDLPHRVLSMVQVPEKTFPGMVTRAQGAATGILDLIPEALLVWQVGVLPDLEMRRRLEKRDAFAWRQLQGPRRKLELVRIKEDAEGALGELMSGRRALTLRFHAVLAAREPQVLLERSRSVVGALDRLGIEMVEEDSLALTLFLQALPLMYEPACDRGMKRQAMLISSNVADLLPLYGSFQGNPTPEVLLQNRRGEPVALSLFDSDVAPHAVVTGVSGAGKSFFMNYLLASVARKGAHVLVLDRGESYRNLAHLVGGQYVRFDPDRPLRINPVGRAEEMTKERLLFVKDILSEMCAQGEEPLRKEERTVLESAVTRAVSQKGRGEVFLSDVQAALLEEARNGPRSLARDLDRLVLSLRPFTGAGACAGFFDGPGEIDFTHPFTVLELGEIALRRDVAPALLMAILAQVAAFFGAPENLARRKYLVLDEAWTLLQSPATARFIENALRTYRKLGAAAVMVTQQVSDFSGSAGAAIRANAPNRIFLRQTAETVQAMQSLFDLSPEVKDAISGLTTAKGRFSEMYVETGQARGVARLVPSRGLYAAFTTDGAERSRLSRRVAELSAAGDPAPLLSAIREGDASETSVGLGRGLPSV